MSVRRSLRFSFIEKYATFIFSIITVVILSRLLTPAQTGVFAVASGLTTVAQIVRDLGVGTYLLQKKDLTKEQLRSAFTIALILGVGFCLFFALASGVIAGFFEQPDLRGIVVILAMNFLLTPFGSVGIALLRRRMEFGPIMRIGIANSLVHSITSVVLAWLGFGAASMAWAAVTGVIANIVTAQIYMRGEVFMRPALKEWKPIFHFGFFATLSSVLNEVFNRLPEITVGRVLGVAATGYYSRGNSFVTLFNQAAMDAIWPVATSGLAQLHREERLMPENYRHLIAFVTGFAWPMLAVLALLAQPIILFVFGSQWQPSIPVGKLLCLAAALFLVGRLNNAVLNATGRVVLAFRAQLAVVAVQLALLLVVSRLGITKVALTAIAVSVIYSFITTFQVVGLLRVNRRELLSTLAHSALIAACTAAPIVICEVSGLNDDAVGSVTYYLLSAVEGGVAVGVWVLMLLLTRHPLMGELKNAVASARSSLKI